MTPPTDRKKLTRTVSVFFWRVLSTGGLLVCVVGWVGAVGGLDATDGAAEDEADIGVQMAL